MKRTLSLKCEALGVLDETELGAVVGGYAYEGEGGDLAHCAVTVGAWCDCLAVATLHDCVNLTRLTCYCPTLLC